MIKIVFSLYFFCFVSISVTLSQSEAFIHLESGSTIKRLIKAEHEDYLLVFTSNNKGTTKYYRSKISDITYLSGPEISIVDNRYTYTTSEDLMECSDPELRIVVEDGYTVVYDTLTVDDFDKPEHYQYRKWIFSQKILLLTLGIDPVTFDY